MNTGDRIKQRRIELGLTADELADRIKKSRATIYRYENGDIENMPTPVLEPLAKALYTTPADLMGWDEEEATADKLLEAYESNIHSDEQLNRIIGYYNDMNQPDRDMLENMAKRFAEAEEKDDN